MPRIRKTGAVYPIRHEQRKTLKDGTVKTYVNWQAKVDGRWVSAKTYKECDVCVQLVVAGLVTMIFRV